MIFKIYCILYCIILYIHVNSIIISIYIYIYINIISIIPIPVYSTKLYIYYDSQEISSKATDLDDKHIESFSSSLPYTCQPGDSPIRRTFRFVSYTLFAIALVPFLNYASITRERMQLKPQGIFINNVK